MVSRMNSATMSVLLTLSMLVLSCGGEDVSPAVDDESHNFDEFDTPFHTDGDGDGFAPVDGDCDDENPDLNPGNFEIPFDGLDNDCNEFTRDDDGDGDGLIGEYDCDDTNPLRYDGAPEIPDNEEDEDCDGIIDELYDYMIDIQPIWNDNCDSCHIGDMSGDLSLGGYGYDQLVSVSSTEVPGMSLIEPFQPNQSYLYRKITNTHLEVEGGEGDPMPSETLLDEDTLLLIEGWILNGSPP